MKMSTFIGGVIVALFYGWKLTLAILALTPLIIIFSFIINKVFNQFYVNIIVNIVSFVIISSSAKIVAKLSNREIEANAKANAIAEEVLTNIRTVFAYNGVKKEYYRHLIYLSFL